MNRNLPIWAAAGLLLAGGARIAAQQNLIPGGQDVGLSSKHALYDGSKQQVIYYEHVVVTNATGSLTCEHLTIDLPPEGSLDRQPTNAVAATNVVVVFLKQNDTNHVTCDRAIYEYQVLNGTTNDTITFLGSAGHPARVENSKGWMTGEPLVWDNLNGNFSGVDTETHFKMPTTASDGTNSPGPAMPPNFLK
jgi:hypothetical protein